MAYRCAKCGVTHEDLPDLGMTYPDPYFDVPEERRTELTTFTPDRCTVRDDDGDHYFIRGVIPITVHGRAESFGIGVWVSQSRVNYERYAADEELGPTFGWLVNRIKHYTETTYLLKARAHFRPGSTRPTIELETANHPLVREQQNGITLARAWEIVHVYMAN